MTLFLFLIVTLHTAVLACIQWPNTFLSPLLSDHPFLYKSIFYLVTITVSCFHQQISRLIGLKLELAYGMLCNVVALLLLIARAEILPSASWLTALAMFFSGAAMLSVFNCLITYTVLVFSKRTLLGIIILYAFANAGNLLAPQILDLQNLFNVGVPFLLFLVALLLMYVVGVLVFFDEPNPMIGKKRYRSGLYLLKQMPLRLPLFILTIMFYSMSESTFSIWSEDFLVKTQDIPFAESSLSIFWLFMILGQMIMLVPLHYFDAKKILYFLAAGVFTALLLIPASSFHLVILSGMLLGGLSCAAYFPIILSLIETEISYIATRDEVLFLPLIEQAISFMTAGYLLSIGITDFWTTWSKQNPRGYFYIAPIYILISVFLVFYLNVTRKYFLKNESS